MLLILLFVLLLSLLIKVYRKQGLSPSVLVISIYVLSSFLSCIYFYYDKSLYPVSFFSILYYACCLALFFLPLSAFSGKSECFTFKSPRALSVFAWIIIICGFVDIASRIIHFDFATTAMSFAEQRSEYYKTFGEEKIATDIWERISSNVYPLMIFTIPLAFYYLKRDKLKSYLLFFASSSIVIYGLSRASRQELVLWMVNMAVGFLMFRDQFSKKSLRRIIIVFSGVVGLMVSLLVAITAQRFGEGDDFLDSFFSYFSAQPFNACYFLEHLHDQALWGQANFPYLVGKPYITLYNDVFNASEFLNVFGTIVGSYYFDFGYFTVFIIGFVALFFMNSMKACKRRKSLLFFYVYIIYMNMMIVGIFYNNYVSPPVARILAFMGILLIIIENINSKKTKYNGIGNSTNL